NLDAKLRRRVREEVRELQQKLGITAVYVTHDQEEALAVSDRIIVMNDAVIAQIGTPRELYEAPVSRFVADFIGDANLVTARIERVADGRALVDAAGLELDLPARGLDAGPALLAVRPRAVHLGLERRDNALEVRIAKAAYLGSHMEYEIEGPLGELFVVDGYVDRALEPGASVWLELAPRGVTLVADRR
ncbi:MAG: ABC transporter ATP-binding protein, partial [Geminicoccaceae bacterium]|nr:ABC transporter ATP-binding protein [Geminicoccaceae bacterium]